MAKKSEDQLAWANTLDTVRTIARLKSRIALRVYLNDVEDEIRQEFDARLSSGLPYKPDLGSLVKGELQ